MTEASNISFGLEISKGFVAKILLAGIGFLGTIVFARVLGPKSFGGFYLVLTIVQLTKLPIDGFSSAAKKRFSETDADRGEILGTSLTIVLIVIVFAGIFAIILKDVFVSYTGLVNASLLFVVLFTAISMFTPMQELLTATGQVSRSIWIDLLRSLFTTPLQLVLVLVGYGATGMAFGLSIATLCTVPVTYYILSTTPELPTRDTFRSMWSYARHSIVSSMLGKAFGQFDLVLLGLLLTPVAAGNYKVAMQLTLPAVMVSDIVGDGLMARISNLHSKGENIAADLSNALAFTSILSIPIFFGGLVLARPLVVTVYGADYMSAAPLLVGLALFRLFRSQTTPLSQAVGGIDRPDINVRISAITLTLNVTLGVALTLEYGSIGVVVATVAAEALRYSILLVIVNQQIENADLIPATLLEQLASAVMMAGIVFVVHQFVSVQSWVHLLVLLGVGGLAYATILVAISETLRQTAFSILRDAGLGIV